MAGGGIGRSGGVGVAAWLVVATASAHAAPFAVTLAPHRAVYEMRLHTARPGGDVTAASGEMTYSITNSCDGWTVETKTVMTFSYSEGPPVLTQWEQVSWEAKDGRRYRFRGRSLRDGVVSEEIVGTARRGGHKNHVRFTKPEDRILPLPQDGLFPTEHTVRLLEAAQSDNRSLRRPVFDGSGGDTVFYVSGLIAASPTAPPPRSDLKAAALLNSPAWRIQLAYFPADSEEMIAENEVTERVHLNGVVDDVVQNYGSFTLHGTLKSLDSLPDPGC